MYNCVLYGFAASYGQFVYIYVIYLLFIFVLSYFCLECQLKILLLKFHMQEKTIVRYINLLKFYQLGFGRLFNP